VEIIVEGYPSSIIFCIIEQTNTYHALFRWLYCNTHIHELNVIAFLHMQLRNKLKSSIMMNLPPLRSLVCRRHTNETCGLISLLLFRIISIGCVLWICIYACIGGTTRGQAWMQSLVVSILHVPKSDTDSVKSSVPVLALALPLLVTLTIGTLNEHRIPPLNSLSWTGALYRKGNPTSESFRWLRQRFFYGDWNMNWVAAWGIFSPITIYVMASIVRKLSKEKSTSWDTTLMHIANASAMGALLACTPLFIPVSRHSPLLALWGWSRAHAVVLHMWAGRIVVIGSTVHGIFHMIRWTVIGHEPLRRMLLPPLYCWMTWTNMQQLQQYNSTSSMESLSMCRNSELECTCYHIIRNGAGWVALCAMWIMAATSLFMVRRRWYDAIFYRMHVLSIPLVLLGIVYHYNRTLLYMAGGLLGYLAASVPSMVENWRQQQQGVQILNIERVGSSCVSLTVAATPMSIKQYQPCQYVYLSMAYNPSIPVWKRLFSSRNGHPFTINQVPRQTCALRVLFRIRGPFTQQLAHQLLRQDPLSMQSPFQVHLSGYHGSTHRLQHIGNHDVVVCVAGGIGITPYLSLLHQLQCASCLYDTTIGHARTRHLFLHWICGDAALIDYVCREYFSPWLQGQRLHGDCPVYVVITVHYTGLDTRQMDMAEQIPSCLDRTFSTAQEESVILTDTSHGMDTLMRDSNTHGPFFSNSRFSMGVLHPYRCGPAPAFIAHIIIGGGGLLSVWYGATRLQSANEVLSRGWVLLFVLLLSLVVSLFVNIRMLDSDMLGQLTRYLGPGIDTAESDDDCCSGNGTASATVRTTMCLNRLENLELQGDKSFSFGESQGRPDLGSILRPLSSDKAQYPCLFICGPASLLNSLQMAVEAQNTRRCSGPVIAIYNEYFEQ
jgi:predicted ferric reductase